MEQGGAQGLELGPGRDQLRTEHDLRYAPEGGGGGKKGFRARDFPDDMKDGLIVGGVGMMAVGVPIDGAQVDLDVADDHLFGLALAEADGGAGEVGAAGVVPKSGLNDFNGSTVIRGQGGLMKLFKPKGLYLQFRGWGDRFLAQGMRRKVRGFHSRNLIPGQITS